jgi:hypothetical protein
LIEIFKKRKKFHLFQSEILEDVIQQFLELKVEKNSFVEKVKYFEEKAF